MSNLSKAMRDDTAEFWRRVHAEPRPTFTPGPWFYEHRKCADGMYRSQVFDRTGEVIADVAWYPVKTWYGTATSCPANGHLIAAAPDLLSAGRTVMADLSARIEAARGGSVPMFRGIADLHAAINKATGSTS